MEMNVMTEAVETGETGSKCRGCSVFPTWFISSAAVILAVTGAAKMWSGFGHTKILAVSDPITGISFGHLMLAVGFLEIAVSGVCQFSKSQKLSLGLIAWLATNFVVYRLGLWWIGWKKPCSCLGNLTDALHISPQLADNIMKVILAYLLIGSYGLLFWKWRAGRRTGKPVLDGGCCERPILKA